MKKTSALLTALLLWGCEQDLTFDLPPAEPQLALLCHFTDGDVFRATFAQTRAVSDTTGFAFPETATVQVFQGGTLVDTLQYSIDPFTGYPVWTGSAQPVPGLPYTVRASVDGFPSVAGTSAAPQTAVVPTVEPAPDSLRDVRYEVDSSATYRVPVTLRLPQGAAAAGRFFRFSGAECVLGVYSPVGSEWVLVDSLFASVTITGALANAGLLTGELIDGPVLIDERAWNSAGELTFDLEIYALFPNVKPLRFTLLWETLSPEYYQYLWTANRQDLTSLFSEPGTVFDNILGGVGNVGGFRRSLVSGRF